VLNITNGPWALLLYLLCIWDTCVCVCIYILSSSGNRGGEREITLLSLHLYISTKIHYFCNFLYCLFFRWCIFFSIIWLDLCSYENLISVFPGLTIQANAYYKMLISWTSQKIKDTYSKHNAFDFKNGKFNIFLHHILAGIVMHSYVHSHLCIQFLFLVFATYL